MRTSARNTSRQEGAARAIRLSRKARSDSPSWTAGRNRRTTSLPEFLTRVHGELAGVDLGLEGCATCHTRERCTSCHVDGSLEPIPSLGFAPVTLRLPPFRSGVSHARHARAPKLVGGPQHARVARRVRHLPHAAGLQVLPRDTGTGGGGTAAHPGTVVGARGRSWRERRHSHTNGRPTSRPTAPMLPRMTVCATTCHTPVTCVTCHQTGRRADESAATATPPAGSTAGEMLEPDATPLDAPSLLHRADPRGRRGTGEQAGFHPSQYDLRHAADAWGATLECSNCHNSTVFCRTCHVESGLRTTGTVGRGYHDAAGPWLLRHGQAARQSLESCVSCHRQRECMQCHSTTGGFRVNPHGDDFDADLMREKAGRTCFACHCQCAWR